MMMVALAAIMSFLFGVLVSGGVVALVVAYVKSNGARKGAFIGGMLRGLRATGLQYLDVPVLRLVGKPVPWIPHQVARVDLLSVAEALEVALERSDHEDDGGTPDVDAGDGPDGDDGERQAA